MIAILLLVVAGGGIYWFMQQRSKAREYIYLQGEVFHTHVHIKYEGSEDYSPKVDSIFTVFSNSLNPFQKGSLINKINENESQETDEMLRTVWKKAKEISIASRGMYDVTASPLINLWGFGWWDDPTRVPTKETIDSLLPLVGYEKIRLVEGQMLKERPGMMLDFSSISKGYCVDLIAQYLEKRGVENYMVEIGGEIAYRGLNPEGRPWRIGIEKPIDDSTGIMSELQQVVFLTGRGAMATSGNYRNYHLLEGVKYGHTINPKTGYPATTDVLSATILAPSCMEADGLATAVMTVGSLAAEEMLRQFDGVSYMLIVGGKEGAKDTVLMSEGFQKLLVQ